MATVSRQKMPQPGDGEYLVARGRAHLNQKSSKKLKSYLDPPVAGEEEVEGEEVLASYLFDRGKEPTASTPLTSSQIAQPRFTSYLDDHQAYDPDFESEMAGVALPKSLPPHLRAKNKAPATAAHSADICDKLLSEHGVRVESAKSQSAASNNPYPSPESAFHQASKAVPAQQKPAEPVRGRSRVKPPQYATGWAKKVPKGDPKRHTTQWLEDVPSKSSSVDSAWADAGYGTSTKRLGTNQASNYALTDWNGDWAPAPVDWDSRPAFRDAQSVSKIEAWLADVGCDVNTITVKDRTEIAASPSWRPEPGSRLWSELLASKEPKPLDDDDLEGVKPWWETRVDDNSGFILALYHPECDGIDPDESSNERIARENDGGSLKHAENRRNTEKAKKTAQHERRLIGQEKARKFAQQAATTPISKIKPVLNIYVRSAVPTDMAQIREIYNHYVKFALVTPETSARTVDDMLMRWRDISQANKLPFLVAVERGKVIKARRKHRGEHLHTGDRIVGFAHADDFNDMQGVYRFTSEIELYTHKQHYMKGVASCLLDKLLALLDPEYVERGGFDTIGDDLDPVAPSRIIKTLIVNYAYDSERVDKLDWVGHWLGKQGFEQTGNLQRIGNKLGRSVNLAYFQRHTGATIDPANPPVTMNYPTQ